VLSAARGRSAEKTVDEHLGVCRFGNDVLVIVDLL
jgi:hypothetical protein